MQTFIQLPAMRREARFSLAAAVLLATTGAVAASEHRPANMGRYYGLYEHRSVAQEPQFHRASVVDPSGSIGREDFGADPLHPEGPGNPQD